MPSASVTSRKQRLSAKELEALIAERFGCRPVQVVVRGRGSDWSAVLIPAGSAATKTAFWSVCYELQRQYELKG
jgi:hypothetical protein